MVWDTGAIGKDFLLALSSARGGGWRSRVSISDVVGVGRLGFVEQGGARVVLRSSEVAHIVVRVRGVVVGFRFPFSF